MRRFLVFYNAKAVADYQTLKGALKFCERKGYKSDENNQVQIFDKDLACYDEKGNEIEF